MRLEKVPISKSLVGEVKEFLFNSKFSRKPLKV